ncbi:hypothetical protein RRG08_026794 [Elysia crispata]|uniref:Uncharacterized protein n=1 Tax=Elysia crispata TaxID=231223 RepID=A0AAE1ARB8_9GAST|nr:hypothetical protein RRG08_026794 [Elysia crispata]
MQSLGTGKLDLNSSSDFSFIQFSVFSKSATLSLVEQRLGRAELFVVVNAPAPPIFLLPRQMITLIGYYSVAERAARPLAQAETRQGVPVPRVRLLSLINVESHIFSPIHE